MKVSSYIQHLLILGQFFPDLLQFCEQMAEKGKIVIVAALDGTFQRKPFGDVLHLVPIAESVTKLHAVCAFCFRDAAFTKRLGDEKEIEIIGGSDKYVSVCRDCFASPCKEVHEEDSGVSKSSPKRRRLMSQS
jgi:thymidine kinase